MAKFELSLGTIAIVAALVWLIAFGGIATIGSWFKPATPGTPGGSTVTPGGVQCPSSLQTTYKGDVINSLDSANTAYLAAVGRLIPNGAFDQYTQYTSGTTAGGGSSVNLKCGQPYKYYILSSQDAVYNPVAPIYLGTVQGSDASRVVSGSNFSKLKAKGYDNQNRGLVFNTADLSAAGTFGNMGTTLRSTSNASYAMGVGTTLDYTVDVETIANSAHFGDSNIGLYIAVDADKSQFDTPTVKINGVPLVDVKNTELSADDTAALSSYEYVFKVPAGVQFNSAPTSVNIIVQSKSGVDPTQSPVMRFIGKASYVGADGFTINTGCFNKASGAEILTATPQTVTIATS